MRRFARRVGYVRTALELDELLAPLVQAPPGSYTSRVLSARPTLFGVVSWPYVTAQWPAKKRVAHLVQHLATAAATPGLAVDADGSRTLLDLAAIAPGLTVVLDHAPWFTREGPLVVNLFVGEERVYSLAFSLGADQDGRRAVWIGAVQGRALDTAKDTYRDLTKALHGMRPRDFLVELFRMLCRAAGIEVIYAVADSARVHRAAYFGKSAVDKLQVNYDEIWAERGGTPFDAELYRLPLDGAHKPVEEVPSKKRAMYRRRYELLDSARQGIEAAYAAAAGQA
ncbi:MAG: DUF535 family protein [Deltaproteobacteria bacterium]|nr:DUF535 family protein [Deltaproteobacteria bacterium]